MVQIVLVVGPHKCEMNSCKRAAWRWVIICTRRLVGPRKGCLLLIQESLPVFGLSKSGFRKIEKVLMQQPPDNGIKYLRGGGGGNSVTVVCFPGEKRGK